MHDLGRECENVTSVVFLRADLIFRGSGSGYLETTDPAENTRHPLCSSAVQSHHLTCRRRPAHIVGSADLTMGDILWLTLWASLGTAVWFAHPLKTKVRIWVSNVVNLCLTSLVPSHYHTHILFPSNKRDGLCCPLGANACIESRGLGNGATRKARTPGAQKSILTHAYQAHKAPEVCD